MLVLLTHNGLAFELTPVNKRAAAQFKQETGHESILIQTNWDYPGLAESCGWHIARAHKRNCPSTGRTDGTITCPHCGVGSEGFIDAASEYLHKREGDVIRGDFGPYFGW